METWIVYTIVGSIIGGLLLLLFVGWILLNCIACYTMGSGLSRGDYIEIFELISCFYCGKTRPCKQCKHIHNTKKYHSMCGNLLKTEQIEYNSQEKVQTGIETYSDYEDKVISYKNITRDEEETYYEREQVQECVPKTHSKPVYKSRQVMKTDYVTQPYISYGGATSYTTVPVTHYDVEYYYEQEDYTVMENEYIWRDVPHTRTIQKTYTVPDKIERVQVQKTRPVFDWKDVKKYKPKPVICYCEQQNCCC